MSRWARRTTVVALILVPFVVLAVVLASVHLWMSGYSYFWLCGSCSPSHGDRLRSRTIIGSAKRRRLLRPVDHNPPMYWTDRDRKAAGTGHGGPGWARTFRGDKLLDFDFYVADSQTVAHELASLQPRRAIRSAR